MTAHIEALDALIAAVEAGEHDIWAHDVSWSRFQRDSFEIANDDMSMCAALDFFDSMLPGWDWGREASTREMYVVCPVRGAASKQSGYDEWPARALLLATMRAIRATQSAPREPEIAPR